MPSAAGAAAEPPVGILGGTFDPVHNAHLAIGRAALEELKPRRILWIPTGAPRYRPPAVASAQDRIAMLRLALQGEPRYALDERELAPGHSGYTVDTLESLRAELGSGTGLFLLIGGDQYEKLATWHRPDELWRLATIVVCARPGWTCSDPRARVLPMPPLAIAASDIRARIGRGEDVSALLPRTVLRYIGQHHLYGHP